QAEDGIRDGHVTGVQTCALPISISLRLTCFVFLEKKKQPHLPGIGVAVGGNRVDAAIAVSHVATARAASGGTAAARARSTRALRSEERRVGKGCRAGVAAACASK